MVSRSRCITGCGPPVKVMALAEWELRARDASAIVPLLMMVMPAPTIAPPTAVPEVGPAARAAFPVTELISESRRGLN